MIRKIYCVLSCRWPLPATDNKEITKLFFFASYSIILSAIDIIDTIDVEIDCDRSVCPTVATVHWIE